MNIPITVSIPGDKAVSGLDATPTLIAKMHRELPPNWTLDENKVTVTDVDGRWVGSGTFVRGESS